MRDVYKNIDDYNPDKENKILLNCLLEVEN